MRGCRHQVILNRLDAKPWDVLEISALGDIKGIGGEYSFLMNWWEGAYNKVFDYQLFAPSLKELHLLRNSVSVTSHNVAFVKILDKQALIVEISVSGSR